MQYLLDDILSVPWNILFPILWLISTDSHRKIKIWKIDFLNMHKSDPRQFDWIRERNVKNLVDLKLYRRNNMYFEQWYDKQI